MAPVYSEGQPMRVQVRYGSTAGKNYYEKSALHGDAWPMPKAIAPDIDPRRLMSSCSTGAR